MRRIALILGLAVVALALGGCRGSIKKKTPIHLNWNMDQVNRFEAQEPNDFFSDNRGNRHWPEGTVRGIDPRGDVPPCVLPEGNAHLCQGTLADGTFATTLPSEVTLDAAFMDRGRERFNIYCAPCHDRVGSADGMVARRGLPPVTFHNDIVRAREVGKLYDTISYGGTLMPGYAAQIPTTDRWAIAAYVRALQISQYASDDVANGAK
jgi:mono/diheme cytochrome c family protein